jgi:hypothetical protein
LCYLVAVVYKKRENSMESRWREKKKVPLLLRLVLAVMVAVSVQLVGYGRYYYYTGITTHPYRAEGIVLGVITVVICLVLVAKNRA